MKQFHFRIALFGILVLLAQMGAVQNALAEGGDSPWQTLPFQDDNWFFAAPGKVDEYQFAFIQIGQNGIESILHPGEGFIGYTSELIECGTGPVYIEADVEATSAVVQLGMAGINADGPSYGFLAGTMNVAIPISSRGFESKGTLSLLVKPEGGYLSIAVQAVLPAVGHSLTWSYVKVHRVRYCVLSELSAEEAMSVLTSEEWVTKTPTPTQTPTETPTGTLTPTENATSTPTVTVDPEATSTVTPTATDTPTPTETIDPDATLTDTPTSTITPTPTATIDPDATSTLTPTVNPNATNTSTPSPTLHAIQEIVVTVPGLDASRKKLTMVLIPAGKFIMGSPSTERSRSINEGPQHEVTISKPFYLGKYEVTQAQWLAIVESNPSYYTGKLDRPVETISWTDCFMFLEKINALGLGVFRLPTEAEWEYACRAGTSTRYSFGNATECDDGYDSCTVFTTYMWWGGNKGQSAGPREVGLLSANRWGLYDMHGNVWEWCMDRYGAYQSGAQTDPSGADSGTSRIARGGNWEARAQYCRSATRYSAGVLYRDGGVGFRLVREVE